MARPTLVLLVLGALATRPAAIDAQQPLAPTTRAQAIDAALTRGTRLGLARADTTLAAAQLLVARALPNPTLAASYSKATPQYHVSADLPFDAPGLRSARVRAAQAGRSAAQFRFLSERAAAALDADTAYTRAVAALARLALSQRNAQDADSLRRIAIARRDAGDASDLEVELATINAGQQANTLAGDSLTFLSTVLDLQGVMGLPTNEPALLPTDSLGAPPSVAERDRAGIVVAAPLGVAAAQASLASAQLAATVERRSLWAGPSLTAGFETGDPTGDERGVLPTIGIAIPLPLLNRNRGPIAVAEAARERAQAELTLAQVQSRIEVARARRELASAQARVTRDRILVASATRVAALALTGYREGASPLATVLEAQRSARDVLAQVIDDLANAWIAVAELRALTLTTDTPR